MKLNQKTLAIAGGILVALLFVAGIAFSPSGFVPANPGATQGVACVQRLSPREFCEGRTTFWKDTSWDSKRMCEEAMDGYDMTCSHYGCICKYLPE